LCSCASCEAHSSLQAGPLMHELPFFPACTCCVFCGQQVGVMLTVCWSLWLLGGPSGCYCVAHHLALVYGAGSQVPGSVRATPYSCLIRILPWVSQAFPKLQRLTKVWARLESCPPRGLQALKIEGGFGPVAWGADRQASRAIQLPCIAAPQQRRIALHGPAS
jgi:hypothetical protein